MHVKNIAEVYVKRMEKDLRIKVYKHHFYAEHYIVTLEFIRFIRTDKTANIIFNKELRITEGYLMVKD